MVSDLLAGATATPPRLDPPAGRGGYGPFPRVAVRVRSRHVLVNRGVRHPARPVAGDLVRFPDGHYSIRTTFAVTPTFHGVGRAFGRRVEWAAGKAVARG